MVRLDSAGARAPASLRSLILLLPALLAAGVAQAQDADGAGRLGAVVVTAARIEQPVEDALPSVTVITREQIDASQSRDLVELLGRQTGIEFARNGGQGAQTSLFVRGSNSNQVLVLVDGAPINSVALGAADLAGFATDDIDRIEIVRGNLSSLYGADAIGGVVQIFTRAGRTPGAAVLAEAGQGHTRDGNIALTTPLGPAMLNLSAGFRAQRAITSIDLAQAPGLDPAADGNWNRHAALRLDAHGKSGEIGAWAWGTRNDTQWLDPFNASASIPLDRILQVQHATQDGVGLRAAQDLGVTRLSLTASQSRDDSIDVSTVANTDPYTDGDNDRFASRRRQLTLEAKTPLGGAATWIAGLEHINQDAAFTVWDYVALTDHPIARERRVDSAWTGLVGQFAGQQWQLNLRHDRYSDFGSADTGLLGWGWAIGPAWKITAQASSGFRAPSFEDLYYPNYSNPALRPERARTLEAGLRWHDGPASAGIAAFRNRIADLIEEAAGQARPANVGHAAIDGIEWQSALARDGLRLGANASIERPRNQDTGQPLLRRAHLNVKLSAGYAQGPWGTSFDLQRTSARDDLGLYAGSVQLAPYTLARLALRRAIARGVQLNLRVENLFNARYQLVDGYNTLPRLLVAGIEARF